MSSKIISRESLLDYIQKKSFGGVIDFMNSLRDKENLQSFLTFFQKEREDTLSKIENAIFHGSQDALDTLVPNRSVGLGGIKEEKAFVYATDDPNYAVFMACLSLDQGEASVNAEPEETMLCIDLDFVNGSSQLKSGYLHLIDKSKFEKIPNNEYRSKEEVEILLSIPVEPGDLTVPICVIDKFE